MKSLRVEVLKPARRDHGTDSAYHERLPYGGDDLLRSGSLSV